MSKNKILFTLSMISLLMVLVPVAILSMSKKSQAEINHAHGLVEITDAWVSLAPPVARNTSGYFKLTNKGVTADRLLKVMSAVAQKVELHETVIENDMVKMRKISDIEIQPGEIISFKPMSYHLMITGLNEPLSEDIKITMDFVFEKSAVVTVSVPVRAINQVISHNPVKSE